MRALLLLLARTSVGWLREVRPMVFRRCGHNPFRLRLTLRKRNEPGRNIQHYQCCFQIAGQ
jgi:hypothetical protein